MTKLKFFIPFILSAGLLFFLQGSWMLKGNFLPALGSFFSPSQGFWVNVKSLDQDGSSLMSLSGVKGNVYFDERYVPHIFCETEKDAYFIQGYVHAKLRLWQMDFSTRAAEGRISELIGEKAIPFDQHKRRIGLKEAALMAQENWNRDTVLLNLLHAYANGVNAYISELKDKDLPIEFKLLNYRPEPWSPYRSALFHKNMAEILCGRDKDIVLTNAAHFFKDDFHQLFPEINPYDSPVIPEGTVFEDSTQKIITQPQKLNLKSDVFETGPFDLTPGLGSNNWAVNGQKSYSGNPILCNDPHLTLSLPSIWFEQQIHIPEYNVYGVGFPGVPGVVIGFNSDIAWGVTNGGWDVLDWYKIEWKDDSRSSYKLDGRWVDTEYRIEQINVRSGPPVFDTIRITHWGPIVYTQSGEKRFDLAMHWIVHEPYTELEFNTFRKLNKAKNFEEYKRAIQNFPYPVQNFAYADIKGEIGITVQGKMPIKNNQFGRFVIDGTDSRNKWSGYLDSTKNPFVRNPLRGFISSANQRSTDLSFPNYYNDGDFRAMRSYLINRMLGEKEIWSIEDMMDLQYNSHCLLAELSLPLFFDCLNIDTLDHKAKTIFGQLKKWDYSYDSSSQAAVCFDLWFESFYSLLWDEISEHKVNEFTAMPDELASIELLKTNHQSKYFDYAASPGIETACDIVQMAFDSMISQWNSFDEIPDWAGYKDASITHLTMIPAFSRQHVRTSGNEDLINAHARTFGPSWRMIVELKKDSILAYGIYPGGQNGHPGSKYYDQMIDNWAGGGYYRLNYLKAKPTGHHEYPTITFE